LKITDDVIEFIEEKKIGKFGTIGYLAIIYDEEGIQKPLISPRHFRLHNDEWLLFDDRFSKYLKINLIKNNNVSVIFVETVKDILGYQLLGEAEYLERGDLFNEAQQNMRELDIPVELKGVVKIRIKKIWTLSLGELSPA
jgi:hypothetical protein